MRAMALDSCPRSGGACLKVRCENLVTLSSSTLVSVSRFGSLQSPARGEKSSGRCMTGFSSKLLSLEKSGVHDWKSCLNSRHSRSYGFTISAKSGASGAQEAAPVTKYPCMYVKGTMSCGEIIRYSGTVVVLGDVQEGASIVADGDIVVLGHLHGDVHGGQSGDRSAVVYATALDAHYIRVADATASVPNFLPSPGRTVIASVQADGTLGICAAVEGSNDVSRWRELHSAAATQPLKRPAQMALFTGLYIGLVGVSLLVFPTSLFGLLFDVRSVSVGWIRVGAVLAVVFGVYYIGTAVGDMRGSCGARAFYMSTVVGRVFLFFSFCWLVAVGAAQRALLLLGIINMLGAMSMLVALRQDSKARVFKT